MPTPTTPTPSSTPTNLLEPLAWMLLRIRQALEESPGGRAPRWVRILRGRRLPQDDPFRQGVTVAVQVLLDFIAELHHLLFDLETALLHIDPPKAVLELMLEVIEAAVDPTLAQALGTLFNEPGLVNDFASVRQVLQRPQQVLDVIPDPADLYTIGHQLFDLLAVGMPDANGVANWAGSGRLRLLAWGFGLPVRVRMRPLEGDAVLIRVGALGVRPWAAGDPSRPQPLRSTWPANTPTSQEIFSVDVSQDQDLTFVHQVLDALGYTRQAAAPNIPDDENALSARLWVFQMLNDLPDTGMLDLPTLHRLLNLNLEAQTITLARPLDPARLKLIPAPPPPLQKTIEITVEKLNEHHHKVQEHSSGGQVKLINPSADTFADEGLALAKESGPRRGIGQETKDPRQYYLCGAEVKDGATHADFPEKVTQGWIRHRPDDDRFFKSEEAQRLDCFFVGLQSRRLLPGGKMFEGGALSEGTACLGEYFFSAREVEPWMSGRNGTPQQPCFQTGKEQWPEGSISGMYQWASIEALLEKVPPDHRLCVQATCMRRSLYKEGGRGKKPDSGRIILGLVKKGGLTGKKPMATRFTLDKLDARAWSGWWPSDLQEDLMGSTSLLQQGSRWSEIGTPPLTVTQAHSHLFVGLYGQHQANLDTDAYFDHVQVHWYYEPVSLPEVKPTPKE